MKDRELWVHPINAVRLRDGHFCTLHTPLREEPAKFINYFRMNARTFDELLTRVLNHLKKSDTNMRATIRPEEILAVTISITAVIQDREIQIPKVTAMACFIQGHIKL
jgi:hypothetical protein